jgi:uncharacterized cupredoxin-like copper-binding protein
MLNLLAAVMSAAVVSGATVPAAPPVVTIHAKDFAFEGPKSIKSGPTTFRLVNDGKELHHLSLVKLGKGKTMKDLGEALKKQGPPPAWMIDVGGPNPAVPGGSVEATLSLEPGDYALLCFINSPGNPTPHMAKGMVGSITVLPESNGATMPTADVTLRVSDYKFTFSKPITAGKHVINVVNDAAQTHEVVFVKLAPGKKIADVMNWAEKDMLKGPPPGETVPGMAGIAKGHAASFPVDLKPGTYGMICFVPDAKDGKSHAHHGMVTQFDVK